MKLNTNGIILSFTPEGNETEAEQAFLARMSQYTIKADGSSILFYNQKNRLISCIKPFDNTQLICVNDGCELAADFGAKRFLVSEARNDETANQTNAFHFRRDLSFPIEKRENETAITFQVLDLPDVLKQFRADQNKLYNVLAELFNRCADFTPAKQNEYLARGAKEDKFCRFNDVKNVDPTPITSPITSHVFLMNNENKIIGTISTTIIQNNDDVDIYFYDEIVDYFTLLSPEQIEALSEKIQQLDTKKDEVIKSTLKEEIAGLIEPKRMELMAQLFAAARKNIRSAIDNFDEKIEKNQVHAFIRAADGRDEAYIEKLGCRRTNDHFVIHGPATAQLKMLDTYVKEWAAEQLKALQPKPSSISLLTAPRRPESDQPIDQHSLDNQKVLQFG